MRRVLIIFYILISLILILPIITDSLYTQAQFYDPFPDQLVGISSGDANGDGSVNLGDAGYIINYVFFDGDPPVRIEDLAHAEIRIRIDSIDEDMQIIKTLIGAVGILDNVNTHYDPEIDPDAQ